jgi:beta-glucosidase
MSISKLIYSCAITALLFISGCGGGGNEATVASNKVANDVTLPAGKSFLPFPNDFVWGSATAAYQVEGARYDETGKALRGDSIWDFASQMGINGDIAIDQYHRYQEDVALMAQAGMKAYRFSISWPRLFKDSGGFPIQMSYNPQTGGLAPVLDANGQPVPATPNPEAVTYYNNLIDELKANGIEPYITLFHWDLPIAFEGMGGFENRQVTDFFQAYAATAFGLFGQKVTHWTTLNEPCSYTVLIRSLFKIAQTDATITNVWLDSKKYYSMTDMVGKQLNVVHNYLLSHAKAVKVFHDMRDNGLLPANSEIGLTLDLTVAKPASNSAADLEATQEYNDYKNGIFTYPIFQGKYPDGMLSYLKSQNSSYVMNISDDQLSDDLAFMKENQGDFVALNYYSRPIVSKLAAGAEVQPSAWAYDRAAPFDGVFMKDIYVHSGTNDLAYNNGTYDPQGFYDTIKWLYEKSGGKKILITENGTGNNNGNYNQDILTDDGKVHDSLRTRYLKGHIQAVWKAINDGIPVIGYFEWSLFDNFEWFTYFSRFGSIYIDYNDNLKRYPKDSYYFLQKTIKNNGVDAE